MKNLKEMSLDDIVNFRRFWSATKRAATDLDEREAACLSLSFLGMRSPYKMLCLLMSIRTSVANPVSGEDIGP